MIRASTPALDGIETVRRRQTPTAVAILTGSVVVAASALTAIRLLGGVDRSTNKDKGESFRLSFAPQKQSSNSTSPRKLALKHTSAGDFTTEQDSNQPYSPHVSRRFPPKERFRLRLHWQPGYVWQESLHEAWFCAACAVCHPDNLFGGLKDCDIKSYCRENMFLAITGCDPSKKKGEKSEKGGNGNPTESRITTFTRFTEGSHGLFDAAKDNLDGDQLQVHKTNLCLHLVNTRRILLKQCDPSLKQQRFLGFRSGGQAMELVPLTTKGTVNGIQPKRCLTQHHEPRLGEQIYAEECSKARHSDTSFWTTF
jgi:hypothetical protein